MDSTGTSSDPLRHSHVFLGAGHEQALAQSQAMQLDLEQAVSKFREVAFVFSRVGTPDIAADPMPPNAADTYVVLKPQEEWPDPSLTKAELIERMEPELQKLVGTSFSFSQPIQMRFNELIAGVRGDVAVKVFGDDFAELMPAAERIAAILTATRGAADVRTEQLDVSTLLRLCEICRRRAPDWTMSG